MMKKCGPYELSSLSLVWPSTKCWITMLIVQKICLPF